MIAHGSINFIPIWKSFRALIYKPLIKEQFQEKCKAIASVVYPVDMTTICEWSLAMFA